MKIDKRNPAHWLYLLLFGLNVTGALALRIFRRKYPVKRVVLYGHKLSGNLQAIYWHLKKSARPDVRVAFLTMDPAYHRALVNEGIASVLAISPRCAVWLSKADAVISDHGLHALLPLLGFSSVKFFDVWHGIPFKGFDTRDFRVQHRYDEVWVPSPLLKKLYVERFGFEEERVRVTGYARTDRLVRNSENKEAIRRRLGLDGPVGKIVLFAPTWKQDSQQHSIFPFGMGEREFYGALSDLGRRTGATFIMRTHLNSGAPSAANGEWPHIVHLPHATYPDTEEILLISDLLVCDWSSIAFDFLLLGRPTIFLDVDAPFSKGFSLAPSYRFGIMVSSRGELISEVERYLSVPASYDAQCSERASEIQGVVYGGYADGHATERCIERLFHYLGFNA